MEPAVTAAQVEAALERWRATGEPDHAHRFEVLARAAARGWTPPITSSPRELHRAWLRAVRDVIGRGWALDMLLEHLPGADPVQRAAALAKRIEALEPYAPDPRFSAVPVTVSRTRDVEYSVRLLDALRRIATAGHVEAPRGLPVLRELPPATPESAALWRDVHAAPDDDGALAVLADVLQLAGDPRGELISLQLAGDLDDEPACAARRNALIASCGPAWLGRLASVTSVAGFERGVLRQLTLSSERLADHASWEALLADPVLATVTDLLRDRVDDQVYARFAASPAMRSLARVEAYESVDPLAAVIARSPSITHVACALASVRAMVRALPSANQLRSIAIHDSEFAELAAAPWFRQLTELTLAGDVRRGLARWDALPRSMTLTLAPSARLPPCSTEFPWDFAITLARDGETTVARVRGEWLLLPVDVLAALPGGAVRVEVDHPSPVMVDRVRSVLSPRKLEVVQRFRPRRVAVFSPARR